MAQENRDSGCGLVLVDYLKDFTIWDFDRGLYDKLVYFMLNCWPVKIIACHVCYAPWIFRKFVKPVAYAVMDTHMRSRILIHDVQESQLLDVLSNYGIHKEMLPVEMGGTVKLDQAEWIANRRASEPMEIRIGG